MNVPNPVRAALKRATVWIRYVGVAVAVALPILVTLDRFRRPFGDKYMVPYMGGAADLWIPYNGARALIQHVDPYMPVLPPSLRDPTGWPQTYPPTMLALYVPLVLLTHNNIEDACQLFYWLNIAALIGFSVALCRLAQAVFREGEFDVFGMFMVILVALGLNPSTMFAVDRAQSELINAALCWAGVWQFCRRNFATAMALLTVSAAIKGYAAILALGFLVAIPTRKEFVRGAISAAITSAVIVAPVAKHLVSGIKGMQMRSEFNFAPVWFNHSFKSLFYQFTPEKADTLRRYSLLLALVACGLSWWRLFSATRSGDRTNLASRAILFATAALVVMIGLPVYSGPYNYLLVLPGLLLLAICFDHVARALRIHWAVAPPLGISAVVALAAALKMRWIDSEVPLGGIALLYLVVALPVFALLPTHRDRGPKLG